jgi:glycosyltransferase involved in cell wall biosynthesis
MTVALFVPAYRVGSDMGGIGVRAWELAQVLASFMPVTIVARAESDFGHPGVRFVTPDAWEDAIATCSSAVFYDLPDTRIMLAAHRAGKYIISDNTVPIEHLEFDKVRRAPDPDGCYHDLVARFRLQIILSDHFVVQSNVARATLITALSLAGRLRYCHYNRSARLAHLFTTIPIGFNRFSAAHADMAHAAPGVDFVWSGGIWDYFDPVSVVAAIAKLHEAGNRVTVRFLYSPPADQRLREGARLQRAIEEYAVSHLVEVLPHALSHYDRDRYLRSARGAVCIGRDSIETYTCVRLRLRDTFLYRLPIVVDRYGASADVVRADGIGIVVDPENPDDLAEALYRVRFDDDLHGGLLANIERLRADYTIDQAAGRLAGVILRKERAPDKGADAHERLVTATLEEWPDLANHPVYPY